MLSQGMMRQLLEAEQQAVATKLLLSGVSNSFQERRLYDKESIDADNVAMIDRIDRVMEHVETAIAGIRAVLRIN